MIDAGVQENCCKTCLNTQAYIPRELTKVNRSYMYLSHVITHNIGDQLIPHSLTHQGYTLDVTSDLGRLSKMMLRQMELEI